MDQAETDSQFTKLVCSLMARETAETLTTSNPAEMKPLQITILRSLSTAGGWGLLQLPNLLHQGMKTGIPRSSSQAEAPAAGAPYCVELLKEQAVDLDGQLRHNSECQRCLRGSAIA